MIVYHLLHYHGETDLAYRDVKGLGFYSSVEEARSAIQIYRTLPGFSDYPNGFCIEAHHVIGYRDPEDPFIYPVGATYWEKTYEDCFESYLEVFGNHHDAEMYVNRFRENNAGFIQDGEFDVECDVYAHQLNEMEWREGFTSG